MQNAFLLALTHLPMSVSVVIVLGALVYLGYNSLIFLTLALLFGAGPIGFLLVYSYEKIFKKLGYIAEDDGKITEDDYDFDVEVGRRGRRFCLRCADVRSVYFRCYYPAF